MNDQRFLNCEANLNKLIISFLLITFSLVILPKEGCTTLCPTTLLLRNPFPSPILKNFFITFSCTLLLSNYMCLLKVKVQAEVCSIKPYRRCTEKWGRLKLHMGRRDTGGSYRPKFIICKLLQHSGSRIQVQLYGNS